MLKRRCREGEIDRKRGRRWQSLKGRGGQRKRKKSRVRRGRRDSVIYLTTGQ